MTQSPTAATTSSANEKFPTFYATGSFITLLTTARHLFLPWAVYIQPVALE